MGDIKELKRVYLEKKTRISSNGQKWIPFLFLFFWFTLAILMIYLCFDAYSHIFLALALVFALFTYLSVLSIMKFRKVYADENFMYVKHRGLEEQIPLENIYAGSRPFISLNSSMQSVKMYYKSASGEKKVVKFVPAMLNQMYNQFIDAIAAKNISIKIKRSFL